jgi:hypothetical protein
LPRIPGWQESTGETVRALTPGAGWLPLIERLSSIEKLPHADATWSIWVIVPKSVVIVVITGHAVEHCRAISAAQFRRA